MQQLKSPLQCLHFRWVGRSRNSHEENYTNFSLITTEYTVLTLLNAGKKFDALAKGPKPGHRNTFIRQFYPGDV